MSLQDAWAPWLQGTTEVHMGGQEDPPEEAAIQGGIGGIVVALSPAVAVELGLTPGEEAAKMLASAITQKDLPQAAKGAFVQLRLLRPGKSDLALWVKAPTRRKAQPLMLSKVTPQPKAAQSAPPIDPLLDVRLDVAILLGTREMTLDELTHLGESEFVLLDTHAGDPVLVEIQGKPFAWAEVMLIDDQYAVRISSLIEDPAAALVEMR